MRLTKYTHACVRIEDRGRTLVVDPGVWAEDEAFSGATDVLITHEHADHVDADPLAALTGSATIYAPALVVAKLAEDNVTAQTVTVGEEFEVAGFAVRAVGGAHAEIYEGLPGCANIGFIIEDALYHPGDS